ncbi:tyrosine-type recombinase/integrase [Actinotalea sp. JY-7876]|uniref:tyrosine-type recombinase/integrase n=1 Tax=Actinotalea sp. JY-7876 TaxID=2758442 RepID=UPI0015F37945|nr:tyrosine-type recombinase/integrase [Actinotalea sp. JY-7876]
MTTTTITTDLTPIAPSLTPAQVAGIRDALEAALSPGTRRVYASSWRQWAAWCEAGGHQALPAHAAVIAAWVVERAGAGTALATVTKDVAAIRAHHDAAGVDDPTVSRDLRQVLRGLRRQHGVTPRRQAHPLVTTDLRRVLDGIDRTTLRGKRDAAILLLGYAAALRRSELADLRVGDLRSTRDGLVVTVRRSKSDQEGAGAVVGVARGSDPASDPVLAVRQWITAADLVSDDHLCQRIARGANRVMGRPMAGQSIATVLQERAAAVGLGDLGVSGHSLRAGHATQAAEAGVDASRIARTTRHARLETLAAYVRPAEALRDTTSRDLGL